MDSLKKNFFRDFANKREEALFDQFKYMVEKDLFIIEERNNTSTRDISNEKYIVTFSGNVELKLKDTEYLNRLEINYKRLVSKLVKIEEIIKQ